MGFTILIKGLIEFDMLFNSFEFPIFLLFAVSGYWLIGVANRKVQNGFLILVSYIFYGWWDWRFLSLICLSSAVDYLVGIGLRQVTNIQYRRLLLALSISVNLGLLAVFKYLDFFIASFAELMTAIGLQTDKTSLQLILPVGISFYTFQTLSYSIDCYRGQIKATKDPIEFFAFVSFFPQLVAGPIERASRLLPQLQTPRKFDQEIVKDGLRRILWGLFKKVVIADTCATVANYTFAHHQQLGGLLLFLGVICFAFQIYCDFSGYSDIAIGVAALFGIRLSQNFATPYFSRNIVEFWQRWHISLSSWFRDYLYISLGGNRAGNWRVSFNILLTFVLSGLWHGAQWTFVIWGLLNGLLYLSYKYRAVVLRPCNSGMPEKSPLNLRDDLGSILLTFSVICVTWVFFRAESLTHGFGYLQGILSTSLLHFSSLEWQELAIESSPLTAIFLIGGLLVVEYVTRQQAHVLAEFNRIFQRSLSMRWALYYAMLLPVFLLLGSNQPFIYFQF